jgi:nucleoside 2-deoxyribosyltransferase
VLIYLASRYSRRDQLRDLAAELRRMGHEITSRWLEESSRPDCGTLPDGRSRIAPPEERSAFAAQDIEDVRAAELVVSITEPEDAKASRGGRHVEFGAAFAWGKRLVVIGYRENVFHHLPGVEFHASQWDWLRALAAEAASTLEPK